MRRRLAVGVVLGMAGLLVGYTANLPAAPVPSINPENGHTIYERHCAECHGPEGRGDGRQATSLSPRPGNLISAQTSVKSDQELLKIIAKGKPRTAMTGWEDRLTPEEQTDVLAYIRSLVKFSHSATPPLLQP